VGTKCDKVKERIIKYEKAKELADKHKIRYFEVSSKDSNFGNPEIVLGIKIRKIK
jgi:hypothetical protein